MDKKVFLSIKSVLNHEHLKELSFESLSALLCNRIFLQNISSFTEYLTSVISPLSGSVLDSEHIIFPIVINPRVFLTPFMIHYNSDSVINNPPAPEDYELLKLSREYVDNLYVFLNHFFDMFLDVNKIIHTVKIYQTYSSFFDMWKRKDAAEMVVYYYKCYHELDVMLKSVYSAHSISENTPHEEKLDDVKMYEIEITKRKEQVIDFVQKLGGTQQALDVYKLEVNTVEQKLQDEIAMQMHKAFWDQFATELAHEPPNYRQIGPMLSDLKGMIVSIIPSRTDLHEILDEYIDADFIAQMVEHNAYDLSKMHALMKYIVKLVRELGSIGDIEDINEWWNFIEKQFDEQKSVSDILPGFFRVVFVKLSTIKKVTEVIKHNLI